MNISDVLTNFICNEKEIIGKIKKLSLKSSSQNIKLYIDPENQDQWIKITFWSEMEEEEYNLLENTSKIGVNDLIYLATFNEEKNVIICACNELLRREKETGVLFREEIIREIEYRIRVEDKESLSREVDKIKLIIYEAELYDATNKKPVLGKDFLFVKKDASFYEDIASRAKNILNFLKQFNA